MTRLLPEDVDFSVPPGWHRLKHLLVPALEMDGTHNLDDVLEELRREEVEFWPGEQSAVVTEIIAYPRKKLLVYWIAGGELEELKKLATVINEYGRSRGCQEATIVGRRGWVRALDDWDEKFTVAVREL